MKEKQLREGRKGQEKISDGVIWEGRPSRLVSCDLDKREASMSHWRQSCSLPECVSIHLSSES